MVYNALILMIVLWAVLLAVVLCIAVKAGDRQTDAALDLAEMIEQLHKTVIEEDVSTRETVLRAIAALQQVETLQGKQTEDENWLKRHEAEVKEIDFLTALIRVNTQDLLLNLTGEVRVEDKILICRHLQHLLRMTRAGEDITDIRYEKVDRDEYAVVKFESRPTQAIDITADSGIAIIRDVVREL